MASSLTFAWVTDVGDETIVRKPVGGEFLSQFLSLYDPQVVVCVHVPVHKVSARQLGSALTFHLLDVFKMLSKNLAAVYCLVILRFDDVQLFLPITRRLSCI